MPDDAELLRRYAESHAEDAFAEFVRRNVDLVYAAALRQSGRDVHEAEDITQMVFARVATKAASLAHHPVIAAWLHQTTRFVAIDAARSRRRREAREEQAAMTSPDPIAERQIAWEEISPELDAMISALGERDRSALILRFFGGKSFAEVGEQLNLGEGGARMRVERALEKLRRRLAQKGLTSSSAALGAILVQQGVTAAPAGLGAAAIAAGLSAPAAGWAAGSLIFMTTTKIALGLAAGIALAGIVAALHEHNAALTAENALAEVTRHAAEVRREPAPVALPPEMPSASPSAAVLPRANPGKAASPANPFDAVVRMLSDPRLQKMTALATKIRLDGQFGDLFKSLNLSPDQLNQFKNLLVEKQMVAFDSITVARDQGIDPRSDPKSFFQAVAAGQKTVDDQITTLLGADGDAQFQQYEKSIPARNTSSLLKQSLSYTSTPLTDDQSNSLVQILTQYAPSPLPAGNPFAVLNGDLGITVLNPQTLAQVQGVLSESQVNALKSTIQSQRQLFQARKQMGP